ncbi:putative Pfs domain protein [Rosellinia necatrix]|uniref:Putative Pfs domain protein n=1 Tax=Rosellinia necatrix TaxID=77044 RepID=A0A1W2TRV2_ROSNE|nr:putative Pfs domain protein [Rosellinia necatrix]
MPGSHGSQDVESDAAIPKKNRGWALVGGQSNPTASRPYDTVRNVFGDPFSHHSVEGALPLDDVLQHLTPVHKIHKVPCPARRKALLIGINYFGQRGQLDSCISDVRNMVAFLVEHLGYKREDMVILSDNKHHPMSQPTKSNLFRAMHWLVKDVRPNDSLIFYYSGHSDLTEYPKESNKGDEGEGGFRSTIFPTDFRQVGHITDQEMHRIMVEPLPAGVRLTAIFDSVHSGSALHLPYLYSTQGILKEPEVAKEAGAGLLSVVASYTQCDTTGYPFALQGLFSQGGSNDEDAYNKAPAIITSGQNILDNPGSSWRIPSQGFVPLGQPQAPRRAWPQGRDLATETSLAEASRFYDTKDAPPLSVANAPEAPTDSGYASAMHCKKIWQNPPDQVQIECTQDPENETQDIITVYSDTSSLTFSGQENYMLELADDLYDIVSYWNPDFNTKERIATVLPDLLRDFALKIGNDAETQLHRNVMVYVHKNRHKIVDIFTEICSDGAEDIPESDALDSEGMSLEDKINKWFEKWDNSETRRFGWEPSGLDLEDTNTLDSVSVDCDSTPGNDSPAPALAEHSDHTSLTSGLIAYRDLVLHTEAYQWLRLSLLREFRLMSTGPNIIQTIRQVIISSLPSIRRVSRKTPLDSYRARFIVDWDPLAFFVQQQYAVKPAEAIEGVISVTGTLQDAQAATCLEYMKQTWPMTGKLTLQLVKQVLDGETGIRQQCSLPDGSKLYAWTEKSVFIVEVSGIASVAEIGEQLGWLGAALRSSSRENGLVYCTPMMLNINTSDTTPQIQNETSLLQLVYEISFIIDEIETPPQRPNGQCWHNLFKNPVVVKGYPILRRPNSNTGLEANLNVLACLTRTQRLDYFKDRVFLKGFSSMLIPTMRNRDTLCWHLVYNNDGSRISYLDHNEAVEVLNIPPSLENLRHILGWCSESRFYGGSSQATYHVGYAGLPRPHADCAFSNVRVSAGQVIAGGPPLYIGLKDTPTHITRNGYIPRLKWISTKLVVLWDAADNRGWLINGTSALLHVVRASLAHDNMDKFKSAFVFKSEYLQESSRPLTPDSATDVLINSDNMKLKLYPEKDGYLTLESRIDHFYNILEKLIDHQADIAGYCGINMTNKPRRNLEGWDFTDLATNHDPLHPRVATIEPSGKGWVELTRAVQAVTLFGRGFGEIIQPYGANSCEYWSELPKNQYYLAACISDLEPRISENGYHNDTHVRLSENIIWNTPTTIFGLCRCRGAFGSDHCEPVQTLLPSSFGNILPPRKHPIPQGSNGAVIFGHNSMFRWVWGDTGQPNQEKLTVSSNASDMDSFYDSGIGTSVVSLNLDRGNSYSINGLDETVECSAEGCSKRYSKAEHLQRHELNRQPNHIYRCNFPNCNREFVRLDLRNRHRDRHITAKQSALDLEDSLVSESSLVHPKTSSRVGTRTLLHSPGSLQDGAVFPEAWSAIDKEARPRGGYTVGILCALPKELMAVRTLFDKRHDHVDIPRDDSNHYALGEICHHMVVAACLPAGEIGTNSAAHCLSNMHRSFPSLRLGFCLLVGIGGGAPSEENDIRLGDVVVSLPTGTYPGVLQYDRGKEKENTPFELTGSLAPPPRCLTSAISSLRSDPDLPPDPLRFYLEEIASRLPEYRCPGQERDQLFKVFCSKCQTPEPCPSRSDHTVMRPPRLTDQPRIHYGLIASGNRVLKDSKVRDTLAREHGVLCFEMEAAGVFNAGLDCLVIRGISDYADAAKNKEWQEYAAASAAAYAKLLLGVMASKNVIDNDENGASAPGTPAKRKGSELDVYEEEHEKQGLPWKRRKQYL